MEALLELLINTYSKFGMITGFLIIFIESIIPVIPSSIFIALNIATYGAVIGYLISYLGVLFGCINAFLLARKLSGVISKKFKGKKYKKFKKYINKISFTHLIVLMAIPFTPAFLINIAAGLSDIDYKKYFIALLLGKAPMVFFWSFIGKNLKESINDTTVLVEILLMVVIMYVISKIVNNYIEKKSL